MTYKFSEEVRDVQAMALKVCEAFQSDPQPEHFTLLEDVSKSIVKTTRDFAADCIGIALLAAAGENETRVLAGFTAGLLHATLESNEKRAALSVFACLARSGNSSEELLKLVELWTSEEQIVISWETAMCLEKNDWAIYGSGSVIRPETLIAATSLGYARLRANEESPDLLLPRLGTTVGELRTFGASLLRATFGYLLPYTAVKLQTGESAIILETAAFYEVSRPIAAVVTNEKGRRITPKIRKLGGEKRQVIELLVDEPEYFDEIRMRFESEETEVWSSSSSTTIDIQKSIETLQGNFLPKMLED